ncbi:MAG TPA: hypothetical protein VGM16_06070, partial [Gammaproteobacteria bacterium]
SVGRRFKSYTAHQVSLDIFFIYPCLLSIPGAVTCLAIPGSALAACGSPYTAHQVSLDIP